MKVCSVPGCPELTTKGKCTAHRSPDNRRSAARRGYDATWRKTRAAYLAANPICSEVGCEKQGTDVDHIDGMGPRAPRGHNPSNLRSFCHACHSRRTAKDQPGGWHATNQDHR